MTLFSCILFKVLVPKDENLMGKLIKVEITETGKHFMKCRLVQDGQAKRPETVPPPLPKGQVSGLRSVCRFFFGPFNFFSLIQVKIVHVNEYSCRNIHVTR